MAKVDLERFPDLIIQIPEEEFPDTVKIVMQGRKVPLGNDAQKAQLAANAKELSGVPAEPNYLLTTWTESDFKKSINGKKTAEVKMPYDEVVNVVGYGHREDPEDDTPINVSMFVTTRSRRPAATSTTYNLDGVWAYNMTLRKHQIDSNYVVQYTREATTVAQVGAGVGALAGFIGQIMAFIVAPSLPTPKQIASKLLGPAAAPVQSAIASASQQIAKAKKTAAQVKTVVNAVLGIVGDPATIVDYLPAILNFILQYIPQEDLSQVFPEFRG
jgi:transglutaminase-like putative cysteine protease